MEYELGKDIVELKQQVQRIEAKIDYVIKMREEELESLYGDDSTEKKK